MSWLNQQFSSWHTPVHADQLIRLLTALVLGGAIGLERQRQEKPAGLRTIILICIGACVFTLVSNTGSNGVGDPNRVAAQIVTGIGFLGAGAILHQRGAVSGLTTAATIWAVAAIGMAVGFGLFTLAIASTVIILCTLLLLHRLDDYIDRNRSVAEYTIEGPSSVDSLGRLLSLVNQANLHALRRTWYQGDGKLIFCVRTSGSQENHDRFHVLIIESRDFSICEPPGR